MELILKASSFGPIKRLLLDFLCLRLSYVNSAITFDASESLSPIRDVVSYAWSFGDGEVATTTTPNVEHTYSTPGFYIPTLTVTNSAGTSTAVIRIYKSGGLVTASLGATIYNNGGPTAKSSQEIFVIPSPQITGLLPSFGPSTGGTSVLISGIGFTGASAVFFGAVQAIEFVVESDSLIRAVTPKGVSTVDVRVVTPAGESLSTPFDLFNFTPLPPSNLQGKRVCLSSKHCFGMISTYNVLKWDKPSQTKPVIYKIYRDLLLKNVLEKSQQISRSFLRKGLNRQRSKLFIT